MTDRIPVESNWERVLYMNAWSTAPGARRGSGGPRGARVCVVLASMDAGGAACVALSCAMAVGMSYFTMACRCAISATAFTVVGNACKVLAIVASVVVWNKRASNVLRGAGRQPRRGGVLPEAPRTPRSGALDERG